jgi:uncharacterized protein with HEPN domain
MPTRPDDLYIVDLIEAGQDARRFVRGKSAEEWFDDEIVRWAVIARLTAVGEAANQLSAGLRERYDDVPWRKIVAFRNVAVHEYFAVEWQVVWQIVERQLPDLIDYGLTILRSEYPDLVAGL